MFQPLGSLGDYGAIPISYAEPLSPNVGCLGSTKRGFDIFAALVLLTILAPIMLLIALAIRVDSPGSVLFRQWRTGYGNILFETLKFRTMLAAAGDDGVLRQARRHDPRVTRVGLILRRYSADELPQLINVLRGEMSLVGPRPHAPGTLAGGKPFELVTPRYYARHRVRPGLTGLAQVRGLRGETETEDKLIRRVEADIEYIEHWSLWLDIRILARTVVAVFSSRNAY